MSQRAEFLKTVEKEDIEALVQFFKNIKSQGKELTDILAECNQRQQSEVWESLRKVCSEVLLDDRMVGAEDASKKKRANQYAFLDGLVTLATITIQQKNTTLPQALIDTAVLLHGVLLTLPDEIDNVKCRLTRLFEMWWKEGLEGWEDIIANTIIYLLNRSLSKGIAADVKAVWHLHTVLPLFNYEVASAVDLKQLLGRCCASGQYLKSDEGRRFLGFALTVNAGLMDWMHKAIKNQIPYAPKAWLPLYGEIYFRAWQKSTGDILQKIENDCIQDHMNHAVHSSRSGSQPMSSTLFRVLQYLHLQKKQRGVDSMLLRLYSPILWRALSVPNADVRANSASLLLSAFPLQDPSSTAEDIDFIIQKQFDFMQRLLADPCPVVRALTAEGICHILSNYLELIPADVVQTFLCKLLKELAWDTSSPTVRLAVVKGIASILDNPMCHLLLKPLLPGLSLCLHDKAETVRIAMMDLLLKVKGIRAIKYWNITPIEDLLARLELDSQPVVRRIVELLFPSFFPLGQDPQEQVSRCVTLIESNAGAARVFFLNAPRHLTLSDTVKYISLLCRYVLESVRLLIQHLDRTAAEAGSKSVDKRSKRSQNDMRQNTNAVREGDESDDQNDGVLTMEMLQGLLEAIFLMWTAIAKQLDSTENAELKQSVLKKLSVTVQEVLKVSDDHKLIMLVVEIAGHLPPKAVPTISRSCLSKLRNIPEGSAEQNYADLLEAMCLWKMAPQVLHLLFDWLEDSLTSTKKKSLAVKKTEKTSKKCVTIADPDNRKHPNLALDYLTTMLKSGVCKRILIEDHRPLLVTLNQLLSQVMVMIEDHVEKQEMSSEESCMFMERVFSLHLRLCVLLHSEEDNWDCVTHIKEILKWVEAKLMPNLQEAIVPDDGDLTKVNEKANSNVKAECETNLLLDCFKVVLIIGSNMLMLGLGDQDFMLQLLRFSQAALLQVQSLSFVERVMNCLYQLLLFEELDAAGPVSKCMSHVMVALNKSLQQVSNTDMKVFNKIKNKLCEIVSHVVNRKQPDHTQEQAIMSELNSTMLAAVLAELQHASRQNTLEAITDGEQEALPPVSACVLNSYSQNRTCRRQFVQEIENCVLSGAITDVHMVHAIVHLVITIHNKEAYRRDLDLASLHSSLSTLMQEQNNQATHSSEDDVIRAVMLAVEAKLESVFLKKTLESK